MLPPKLTRQTLLVMVGLIWIRSAHLASIGEQAEAAANAAQVANANAAAAGNANQQTQMVQQPQRLPKINIYLSKNEIKKLLGIDTRINYVTNGTINTYPLAFTIPLGYNLSDIIFTWQNLGQTNVNYSISLAIGNLQAVNAPLINITRSGLIPKQEQAFETATGGGFLGCNNRRRSLTPGQIQRATWRARNGSHRQEDAVFKITLPCSGLVTDEVDVQVLINITGYVEVGDGLAEQPSSGSADSFSGIGNSPWNQNGPLEQSVANLSSQNGADSMQSDQAPDTSAPKLRLVSHTLAIKRKKICTQQPVQVAASTGRTPPPAQRTLGSAPYGHVAQSTQDAPGMPVHSEISSSRPMSSTSQTQQQQTSGGKRPTIGQDQPSQVPGVSSPPSAQQQQSSVVDSVGESGAQPAHLTDFNPAGGQLSRGAPAALPGHRQAGFNEPFFGNHPHAWPYQQALPPAIPADNPINDIMPVKRTQPGGHQHQVPVGGASSNPLVLTLVGLSLIVSLALVLVMLLSGSALKRSGPFDKLSSITGCLLRRAPGPMRATSNKCKSPMAGAVISSLRAGPKSADSVVSTISGGQTSHSRAKQHSPAYCYKTSCPANGYYTTTSSSGQYQHYQQHPPTADLLGTGYQCQPAHQQQQQQYPPPPQFPIYHIATGSNSQTTRLIWNNGNGTSPDGFRIDRGTYMPLSNAARSDSGSVYQTIY